MLALFSNKIKYPKFSADRENSENPKILCRRLQLQNGKYQVLSVSLFDLTAKTDNFPKSICCQAHNSSANHPRGRVLQMHSNSANHP